MKTTEKPRFLAEIVPTVVWYEDKQTTSQGFSTSNCFSRKNGQNTNLSDQNEFQEEAQKGPRTTFMFKGIEM